MATISTSTYLDGGTARTSAETWTLNSGGVLTIRTDTRWHANAPASMTGILGTLTASGGGVVVDGTKVRWMAFTAGSGTVPAIGTTVSDGTASGYLLGVWADYTSAPTAVGAAMPATGYIKFREVNGGQFAVGGTLTGITATPAATNGSGSGADAPGWIEVVGVSSGYYSGGYAGPGFVSNGAWFYLDNTTGTRGQTFQIPTNSGGTATGISGIQVETSPGSGVYEWYAGVPTTNWTTTNITTDARAKLFEAASGGVVRIGANSSGTAIGYQPAAGCKVRIPNVFLRSAASATPATNTLTSTITARTQFQSSTGTIITMDKTSCDWGLSQSTGPGLQISISDSCIDGGVITTQICRSISLPNTCVGQQTTYSSIPMQFTVGINLTFTNLVVSSNTSLMSLTRCGNITVNGLKLIRLSTSGTSNVLSISTCDTGTFTNLYTIGGISVASSSNITIDGHDYINQSSGATTSAGACFTCSTSANITHKNLTFGLGGTLSNTHPNGVLYSCTSNNGPIKCYNAGTQAAPLNTGTANYSTYIFDGNSSTNNTYIYLKRIYLNFLNQGLINGGSTNQTVVFENLVAQSSLQPSGFTNNGFAKGLYGTFTTGASGSTVGFHFHDIYNSATAGQWKFYPGGTPGTNTPLAMTYSITNTGNAGWDNAGNVVMLTNGDTITIETPYYVKGSTGFTGVFSGNQTNTSYVYWIDTGSGYGSSKTLNSTNLQSETLNPAGTKMKIQLTKTGGTSVTHSYLMINTVSSLSAQTSNLYPLDTATLSFTGLQPGSEVRCYTGSDPATAVEIGGIESTSGSTFSFSHSSGGSVGYIRIFALGYQPVSIDPYTYSSSDTSLLIQQVIDRNYVNPP